MQLALTSDDRLPALESLEFLSTSYVLTEHHCLHLLANIDCGKLQRLILGSPNPINFFDVFHGRLPHLKHLEVSFAVTGNCKRDLQLGSATNFVIDLRALRSLVVCCDVVDLQMDFLKLMAYKIGPNLHHLSLRARQEDLGGPWYVGGLHDYLSYWFNNLRSLDLAFSDLAENYACPDCELYQWCVSIWHRSHTTDAYNNRVASIALSFPIFRTCTIYTYHSVRHHPSVPYSIM